jgi:hypothetical protein
VTQYLKYLLSLCLAFGLVITDGILDSRSNATPYDQISYLTIKKEFDNSKTYRYDQLPKPKKTSLPNPFAKLQLLDICSLQIKVVLKLRIVLHQNISATKEQQIFLAKIISSSNPYSSLYIA